MSWLEDHEDEMIIDLTIEENDICEIRDKLNNEKLDKFNEYLKDNYIELVCDIMFQYKRKGEISDKQKHCIAQFIYENQLQMELDLED